MRKYYIIILFLAVCMGAAVFFVFYEIGSPFELRNKRLDAERISELVKIRQGAETFYMAKKTLPNSLDELYALPENSLIQRKNDPESNAPYEYQRIDDLTFNVCATFSAEITSKNTDKQEDKLPSFTFSYPVQNQELPSHPKGYYCYTVTETPQAVVPDIIRYQQTYSAPVKKFADAHIKNVTTDAKNIQNYNFPYSMFNTTDEWGLINFTSDPVHATVTFTEPTKVSSITNRFSVCLTGPCYEWEATGKTKDGKEVTVVSKTNETYRADPLYLESKKPSQTAEQLVSITFTITRLYTDRYVHWRKLSFEY